MNSPIFLLAVLMSFVGGLFLLVASCYDLVVSDYVEERARAFVTLVISGLHLFVSIALIVVLYRGQV